MANSVNKVNKKKKSQAALVWRRLQKNNMAILGLVILSLIIFFAVFADFFPSRFKLWFD